jgi:hypothetical protein
MVVDGAQQLLRSASEADASSVPEKQARATLRFPIETGAQVHRLRLAEVGQLDPLPDVEGRGPHVADQIRGRAHVYR